MNKQERSARPLPENIVWRGSMLYVRVLKSGKRISVSTRIRLSQDASEQEFKRAVKQALERKYQEETKEEKRLHIESKFSPVEKEALARDEEKYKFRAPETTYREFVALPDGDFAGGPFWTEFATGEYAMEHQKLTIAFYRQRISVALKYEALADAKLHQIDSELLRRYIHFRRGQRRKPSTISSDITALHVVLTQAFNLKFIREMPAEPEHPSKSELESPGISMERREEEVYFGTPGLHPDLALLTRIMITTSLEPGPMVRLDWSDVFFADRSKHAYGHIHGRCKKKGRRERDRPMSKEVAALMRERWFGAGSPKTGYVFPSPMRGKNHPTDIRAFQARLNAHLTRIREEVPGEERFRRFRLYDFRHTFLTRYWATTHDLVALMHVAGWTDIKQAKTYVHLNEDDFRAADEAVFAAFGSQVKMAEPKIAAD